MNTQQGTHLPEGGRSYIFNRDIEFALRQHIQTGPRVHPVGTFYTDVIKPEADTLGKLLWRRDLEIVTTSRCLDPYVELI